MKKITIEKFGFDFFLGGKVKVDSLENGATEYGGATQFDNGIYSNIESDNFIKVNNKNNNISLFIPSTINTNEKINNTNYVKTVIRKLKFKGYDIENMKFYNTKGSWYSEDKKEVVIENITILTISLKDIKDKDIYNFIEIANFIKEEMNQEGVSLQINTSLAII